MSGAKVAPPRPGEVVGDGRFELVESLAERSGRLVFRARDRSLSREVALILLDARALGRVEGERGLLDEAARLRRVRGCAHVVEFLGAGRLMDRHAWPWFATELLDGQRLAWRLTRGPLGISHALAVARAALLALRGCHAAGVVHGRVGPQTLILLAEVGAVAKLVDFRHAREFGPRAPGGRPERMTGVFQGSAFADPAAYTRGSADPRDDVYRFGALVYALVSGHDPLSRSERESDDPEPLRLHAWVHRAPTALADLVHACTRADAHARPSISELIDEIDEIDDQLLDGATVVRPAVITDDEPTSEVTVRVDAVRERAPLGQRSTEEEVEDEADEADEVTARVDAAGVVGWRARAESQVVTERGPVLRPTSATASRATLAASLSRMSAPVRALRPPRTLPPPPPASPPPTRTPTGPSRARPPARGSSSPATAWPSVIVRGLPVAVPPSAPRVWIVAAIVASLVFAGFGLWLGLHLPEPSEATLRAESLGSRPIDALADPTGPSRADSPGSPHCRATREAAERAVARRAWPEVLESVARRGCWAEGLDRARLEVRALAETRAWAACVAAGEGSDDPMLRRLVDRCRAALR